MAGKNKARGLMFLLIIATAAYFMFFWEQGEPQNDQTNDKIIQISVPDDAVDCSYDVECLKDNADIGSFGLVEEEPTPYTVSELKKYEIRGEEPPERTGPLWSHHIVECNEGECNVAIKMERIPSETPDFVAEIMKKFNKMECQVPLADLGTIPEDKSKCSGPYLTGLKLVEEAVR